VSHLAKRAQRTVHRQKPSLSSTFFRALSTDFIECQTVLGKESGRHGAGVMETTSLPSVLGDTRQRSYLCRVSPNTLDKEGTSLPSVCRLALDKGSVSGSLCQFLCRMFSVALGKACLFVECQGHHTRQKTIPMPRYWYFAECYDPDTRQSDQYTPFLFVFYIPSKQTKDITYTSQISSQISHIHHI
jgi:hypothetical protein